MLQVQEYPYVVQICSIYKDKKYLLYMGIPFLVLSAGSLARGRISSSIHIHILVSVL